MSLWWLFLIIPAGVTLLLFLTYFYNLDMKLVAGIYKTLIRRHDKVQKDAGL